MTDAPAETVVPVSVAVPHTDDDFEPDPKPTDQGKPDDALGDAGKQAIDRMKADKVAAEKRAKALERDLNELRRAQMSESEKAVAEAETRGRQAAAAEFGSRLARSAFDALAARRNPDVDTDQIVEFVDMRRFLDDDGEVDRKALQSAVDRLVPERPTGPPSFDGGARTTAPNTDMNAIIRAQARGGRNP
jgi:hypothetical protein